MPDVLYDPEKQSIDVLKDSNGPVYAPDNPQTMVRKCCGIVRELCRKRGIDESACPCIHRMRKRFRYWDLRQGRAGASHKCVLLCSPEWRIATVEEVKAQHGAWEKAREEQQKAAEEETAKKLVAEAAVSSVISQAGKKVAEESKPSGATGRPDPKLKG